MKRFRSAILVKLGLNNDHLRQMIELIKPHWKKLALSVLCMVEWLGRGRHGIFDSTGP